jgi:hypothetical protein
LQPGGVLSVAEGRARIAQREKDADELIIAQAKAIEDRRKQAQKRAFQDAAKKARKSRLEGIYCKVDVYDSELGHRLLRRC